jgi:hypothetical protein
LSDFLPEPDNKAFNASGNILDKEKFTDLLKECYRLRGWNEQSGLPKHETLTSLGMNDIAAQRKGQGGGEISHSDSNKGTSRLSMCFPHCLVVLANVAYHA